MSKAETYDHVGEEDPTPWWFWCIIAGLIILEVWCFSTILEGYPI